MHMTCPKCHGEMRVYERSGVTIDQCTECRGIFLDRGELEKLFAVEANYNRPPAGGQVPPPPAPHQPGYPPPPPPPAYGHPAPAYGQPAPHAYPPPVPAYGHHGHYRRGQAHHGHYRRRGFLHDLFD
ncbi:zf-TFIIB domain-containing protein [Actinoplanes sp. NEAU-A12]|uniref:Zf-TFIIB domain-containing protein n=1 Tax=Actinoplanes sandaracinus TaxID=3045177 RepID=A0ABT6WHB2_9ACTN|nr:zf-TFIIB domain-containing protein [Actinoplanes sandaracinus]MDI6099119.1 zf-TFIIB domain-containing protein [Actinoplanes sandaracinus]